MDKNSYLKLATEREKTTPCLKNCLFAFLSGGAVCLLGQAMKELFTYLGAEEKTAYSLVAVTLVFAAGLCTGLGFYDKAARVCGAGLFVPITGFANAVASPAIEARCEGAVNGVGSEIFKIAGPVIVYGNIASVIYGVIYYIYLCFAG